MASGRSIEKRKGQIKEITSSLERREKRVEDLEGRYAQAMDARMALEGVEGLDDEAREYFQELSADDLENLHEEGEELADEMMDETQQLEEVRQENADAMEGNCEAAQHAKKFESATDGNATSAIEQNSESISEVTNDINDAQKKIDDLSNRARNLSKRGGSF